MNVSTPLFIDESTFRFCPTEQIDRIVETEGYDCFVSEEIAASVRKLPCSVWIDRELHQGRVVSHRITRPDDIRLVCRLTKCSGACRGEICSYVAAQRERGIIITQDPVTRKLLAPHFPGVTALEPDEFLSDHPLTAERELLSNKQVMRPTSAHRLSLAQTKL